MTGAPQQRTDLEELLGIDVAYGPGRHEILESRSRNRVQRSNDAFKNMLKQFVLLLVMGIFAVEAAQIFTDNKLLLGTICTVVVFVYSIRAYIVVRFAPASVWETMTWLDLDERSWNTYMRYTDGALPTTQTRLPFDDLAVLFYAAGVPYDPEAPVRYIVALCLRTEAEHIGNGDYPAELTRFNSAPCEQEKEGRKLAVRIATRYDIACWEQERKWEGARPSRVIRLC